MKYAAMLAERMERHGTRAWLINTGWTGGSYGGWVGGCCYGRGLGAQMITNPKAPPASLMLLFLLPLSRPCTLFMRSSMHARPSLPTPTRAPTRPLCACPGVGRRISLAHTRAIVDAIHSGELSRAETVTLPIFGLQVGARLGTERSGLVGFGSVSGWLGLVLRGCQ